MSFFSSLKASVLPEAKASSTPATGEKGQVVTEGTVASSDKEAGPDLPNDSPIVEEGVAEDAQRGVQKVEAITLAWSKWALIGLFFNIWLVFFTNGMRGSILAVMTPFITSEWSSHSLLAVIDVVSDAMTAAVYIPMAKLLDVWGRAEGFALMVGSATLGTILMACSTSLPMFCAAKVFYSIGYAGIIYVVAVLAADISSLRNRGIAFAFTSSAYMITAFAGSKAAEAYLLHVSWQWAFGSFVILVPVITAPLFITLKLNERKALKEGIIEKNIDNRPILERITTGLIQFDIPGVILFAGGLVLFLVPFNIATAAPNGWKTDYIIAMIVVGFVLLVCFGLYEVYLAPAPFLKGKFITDRTVLGACFFDMIYQISYYCWANYFSSFLLVVTNLGIAESGYVASTFQVVSGVVLFIVGYFVRRTGRFKWLFYICCPIYVLGLGLMIHFRQPNTHIGWIIMCEILMSIGGSVFILLVQLAVLAAVDHQHVAAALALLYVSGTVGGAIGGTVSGAIWTNTFLGALQRNLPESAQANVLAIYGNIYTQLAYPVGSIERLAIQESYGYAQSIMVGSGVGLFALASIGVVMMRNIDLSVNTQTKGRVF